MLIALLLATAAPQLTVHVAPADVTAKFKGDGGSPKFDPSCGDFTLDTLPSDPACAARVAKGEVAPTLAIASRTVASPTRRSEAIQLLERTAAATGSPAVHYFLGMWFGTAQVVRPDYAAAVRHLTIAAEHGNPAAADLLASLLIWGKGAPRDVPRAIRLYEAAAANGFPSAAVKLGILYLAGKSVPKDEDRGRAWLDAAAAVNAPDAAQLAAIAKIQSKIVNYQVIPSPDPVKVKAVRYGTFDNPDFPPNFGFDLEFQAVYDAPYDDQATLERLENRSASLPTPYLYELARRLAARNPEKSLQTYLLARTRMTYDASRCADPAALESLRIWDMVVASDMRFIFAAGPLSRSVVDQALAEEAKLPGGAQPWWVCRSGLAAMTAAIDGKPGELQLKPASEWPELRKAARALLIKMARPQEP